MTPYFPYHYVVQVGETDEGEVPIHKTDHIC